MIVNQHFILKRIQELIIERQKPSIKFKEKKSILTKLLSHKWILRILFHPYNIFLPLFGTSMSRKSCGGGAFLPLHPFAFDFIQYAIEQDVSIDLSAYFDEKDEKAILLFINNRIKCLIAGTTPELTESGKEDVELHVKFLQKVRLRNGFYQLRQDGRTYFLPETSANRSIFFTYVFIHNYGLKFLTDLDFNGLRGKDMLDIGALYGDTSIMLLQYQPRQIYAYEPVSSNFQMLQKTINKNAPDKITAVNKGLGDVCTTALISVSTSSSSLNASLQNSDQVEKINIATIDDECKDRNVGLMKMDVEGFESYVIKGGLATIERDKPALLISIYHTGKDFFEIIPQLKKLVPEYKFRFIDLMPRNSITEKIIAVYIPTSKGD